MREEFSVNGGFDVQRCHRKVTFAPPADGILWSCLEGLRSAAVKCQVKLWPSPPDANCTVTARKKAFPDGLFLCLILLD